VPRPADRRPGYPRKIWCCGSAPPAVVPRAPRRTKSPTGDLVRPKIPAEMAESLGFEGPTSPWAPRRYMTAAAIWGPAQNLGLAAELSREQPSSVHEGGARKSPVGPPQSPRVQAGDGACSSDWCASRWTSRQKSLLECGSVCVRVMTELVERSRRRWVRSTTTGDRWE